MMFDIFKALLMSVSNIDPNEPQEGDTTTADTRANFAAAKTEIEDLQNNRVTGPESAVNNRIATFLGTTGKVIQDSGSLTSDFEPANANIQSHISSTANPHSVTKAQVGLGNADNTSDADKPVSDATALELLERPKRPSPATTVVGRIVEWDAVDGTLLRQSGKSTSDLESDTSQVQTNLNTHAADNTHLSTAERAAITSMGNAPTGANPFISQDDFASGGGHVIQDNGVNQTQRGNLNFLGTGVSVDDNAGNNSTDITITAGSGGGASQLSELTDVSSAAQTAGNVLASSGGPYAGRALIASDLPNTAVTPGSYTNTDLTVDAQGRITAAANGTGGGDLSNAVFPDSASFEPPPTADATVDFNDGNNQEVDAATHPSITLTGISGKLSHYTLIILNSGSLTNITPAIAWGSSTPPAWAGRSVLSIYDDGTTLTGSAVVDTGTV